MNPYDHEDAFVAANRCAGRYTNLSAALRHADNQDMARIIIEDCKEKYQNYFDAFLEGVEYGRANPKEIDGEKK
jgi:hypothetical protein